ncbi:MAG TPA: tRNA (adenosine(37)-N6)-dimethylallyltransferase MiaA [bacterium]|nr:tRNA (adenosine(37)-N6)-dimethylallyltransferase MiaA [bacterium]
MESSKNEKVPVICGPTASGKTELGIRLCERIGGEIISMDSRQIYRYLDVGTAKATEEEQARAAHHLIDIVDPGERFTVADFVDRANECIEDIRSRGKKPVIVGGTPLYLSALMGDFEFCEVDSDMEFREKLREEAEISGSGELHKKLAELDPATAGKIHPNDQFRVIRALEIIHITGEQVSRRRPKSVLNPVGAEKNVTDFAVFSLYMQREKLYERINKRVTFMYNNGLMEETQLLIGKDPSIGVFLEKIIGYSQCVSHLTAGVDSETAIEETRKQTRRFAKRQLTWLRSLEGVTWLNLEKTGVIETLDSLVMKWITN